MDFYPASADSVRVEMRFVCLIGVKKVFGEPVGQEITDFDGIARSEFQVPAEIAEKAFEQFVMLGGMPGYFGKAGLLNETLFQAEVLIRAAHQLQQMLRRMRSGLPFHARFDERVDRAQDPLVVLVDRRHANAVGLGPLKLGHLDISPFRGS